MGNNLSSQSERSFRIPKQSIVIEPVWKEDQKSSVNQSPAPKADQVSRDQILPIIMWMFSGSNPLRNFLLKLIPSKSTKTLLRTSNPFSGTTWNKNPQKYSVISKEPPRVHYTVCLTVLSLVVWLLKRPMAAVPLTSFEQHGSPAPVRKERRQRSLVSSAPVAGEAALSHGRRDTGPSPLL